MYWLCIACHLEKKCMCVHGCLSTKVYVCLFIRSRYTQRSVEIYRVKSLDLSSPISVDHYLTAHNESSAFLSGWWNHRCKGERASRWYEWALRSHVPTIQHEPVMKRQVKTKDLEEGKPSNTKDMPSKRSKDGWHDLIYMIDVFESRFPATRTDRLEK